MKLEPHEAVALVNGCKRLTADPSFKTTLELMRTNFMLQILATDAGQADVREALYNAAKGLDALETQVDNFANGDIVDAQE